MALPLAQVVLVTIVVASVSGSPQFGLILGGVELLLGAVLLAVLSPLIMLRADEIRIWHGFRFINIGINEIAGIGMLYAHTTGYGGGWRLFVWREDGSIEGTGFTYLLGRSPRLAPGKGRWNWARQANYDPVSATEILALNACKAATVGRDLCQRVVAAQGQDGQFTTRHLEKHQHPFQLAPYTQVIAWWSPDGQSGHCR